MESTDRRDVCVRGRISMCRVGVGQDESPECWKSRWNQRLVEADRWSPQCKRKSSYTHQKCCRTLAVGALLRPHFRAVTWSVWVLCLPAAPSGDGLSVRSSSSQWARQDTQCSNSLSFKQRHRGTERAVLLRSGDVEMLKYSFIISKFKLMP